MSCTSSKGGVGAMIGVAAALAFSAGTMVGASERQPEMEEMDPMAMMAAMQEANTLTEHHERFESMVGVWDGVISADLPGGGMWESKGVMTNELVMGGRFVQGTWKGDMMGQPFTGVSLMGYSKLAGEYQSVWYDSTANQVNYYTGSANADGTTTMMGEETDPMTGTTLATKDILSMQDENHMTMVRTYVTPTGEEPGFKIEYTRRK
ncbi:MAG: DUF1579 family protein [Planctomycetota bacterium]